jgi:hypothetical protein
LPFIPKEPSGKPESPLVGLRYLNWRLGAMKRISSGKLAPKILNTEFPQDRNASAARKLWLDLSAVKGLAGLSAEQERTGRPD